MSRFELVCTEHHSLLVEPWCGPTGVKVTQADDPEEVVLLLRDQVEVLRFTEKLRNVSFGRDARENTE
jgi:hypothetical protein